MLPPCMKNILFFRSVSLLDYFFDNGGSITIPTECHPLIILTNFIGKMQ